MPRAVDLVELQRDGDQIKGRHAREAQVVDDFRCSGCGYGIVSRGVLPTCPMCRGAAWEESPWRYARGRGRR